MSSSPIQKAKTRVLLQQRLDKFAIPVGFILIIDELGEFYLLPNFGEKPDFFIPAIGPGQFYGPTGNNTEPEINPCTCSTVYFSLLTVCSACQAADTAAPPAPLPTGLAIPHWAYLPLLANGSVNVAAIVADHHILPTEADILGPSSSAETSKPSSPVSASTSAIASPSIHRQNTGLIIGAVVGPVAFLALLALCTGWWCLRRKSNSTGHRQNDKEESAEVKSSALLETIVDPFIAVPLSLPYLSQGRLSAQSSDQEISHPSAQGSSKRLTGATVYSEHRSSALSSPSWQSQSYNGGFGIEISSVQGNNGPLPVHGAKARVPDVETRPMSTQLQPAGRPDSTGQISVTSTQTLESQLRAMQTRVEMLTSEMNHMSIYMEEPPAYDNGEVTRDGTHNG
ncbi:hypothetical protein D9758_012119 [Tetrapyrgos nigripes]|uniref:Uncharacterized protein n=1 Tax=Tetrapyrgos nigripes TaxID=182062 RepID=A0A8H5CLW8_9AGAR|nr:hypothetical protein D9758_012119 [Tetrapyrgos nigripes]